MRNRDVRKAWRRLWMRVEIWRERDLVRIVKIEKLVGRGRRAVRFIETNREKERLVFIAIEKIDRARGDLVIAMRLTFAFQHDDSIRSRGARRSVWLRRNIRIVDLTRALTAGDRARRPIDDCTIDRLAAFGPGNLIVYPAMENLARAQGRISLFLKVLRQRYIIRMLRSEVSVVVHHAGLRRVASIE